MAVAADDDENQFLRVCRSVARRFLNKDSGSEATRSPDCSRGMALDGANKILPLATFAATREDSQVAAEIARRLRELGSGIDEKVKEELQVAVEDLSREPSAWKIGLPQFSRSCRQVLQRSHGSLRSGWECVWMVYIFLEELVKLRQQQQGGEGSTGASPSQRERKLQDLPGQFMREYGLQGWVEQQGGMVCMCVPAVIRSVYIYQ